MKKIGAKIIVNGITMLRIIGTFLMPFIFMNFTAEELITYIIFLLITDVIDGMMARRLHVSTLFGALLDALADKLLGIATILVLARYYLIMVLPIITETIITLINTSGATKGSTIDTSKLGKFKTWILGICIVVGFITMYANEFIILLDNSTDIGVFLINILNKLSNHPNEVMNNLAFICVGADLMVAFDYSLRVKRDVAKINNNGINTGKYKLKKGKELIYALFDEEYYQKTKKEPIILRIGKVEE